MPGSNNTGQVTTPARTGVHPFVLRLDNTLDPGKVVDFAFTVSLGSATLVSYAQSDRPYVAAGYPLRATEGDLAATFLSFGESKNLGTLVTLDFGSTPQAADVRLDCSAEGIRDIVLRWPDGMGNYAALFVDADANGNLYSVPGVNHLATIPAQSGLVTVTVSVSAEADFNYADWTLNLPGSVKVVETHAPTGGGSHGAGREGQGCSTSPDGRLPLVLAAAAGAALTWRRRRKPI
jgi:MYXO-CTERM domain-containing protein